MSIEISILDTESEIEQHAKFNAHHGTDHVELSDKHIHALLSGRKLVFDDAEYTTVLYYTKG